MPDLPARPNLDQLRHQAKDLLRAARAGDAATTQRIEAVSDRLTLAAAQLVVAREYGFSSWARLKEEVDARTMDLAQKVEVFLEASIRDWTGRAARLLAATPEIVGYNFATAVMLGDADRVRVEIERDPALATRPDPRSGWTPLHAVCGSRWHRLDPARADGLLSVARLLLDAGADLEARAVGRRGGGRTPLQCAAASASAGTGNEPLLRLLLERGAVPEDGDLYMVAFGRNAHQCLRLLLDYTPDVAGTVEAALSAPISIGDTEGCRLLLEAGADPRRYVEDPPCSAVYAAVRSACSAELLQLLLAHGGDPDAPGPDGRSPYRLAVGQGKIDLAAVLRQGGARDDATDDDRFLSACLRADHDDAQRQIADHPGILDRLTDAEQGGAIVQAAEAGSTAAVELMLDLGFPIGARGGDGATALHAAAFAGSAETVRTLLHRSADIEARDTTWDDTPLVWATIGSGVRPARNPNPNWVATVRTLIEAGASIEGLTLSPDDPKPPSPEVAQFLRAHGVGDERSESER
jgi:ankyrin repeat protein